MNQSSSSAKSDRSRMVLFDCDGTLVDSQSLIARAMAEAWIGSGAPSPEPQAVRSIVGLSLMEAVRRLHPEGDQATHTAMVDRYRAAFSRFRATDSQFESLYPGTREALLDADAQGFVLGIATGKGRRGLREVLEHHDLLPLFATLQTADDAPSKPHPAMVQQAAAEVGVPCGNIVVVGDTTFDMEMGSRAGARTLGVSWGYHTKSALERSGAELVLGQWGDLGPWLTQWLASDP